MCFKQTGAAWEGEWVRVFFSVALNIFLYMVKRAVCLCAYMWIRVGNNQRVLVIIRWITCRTKVCRFSFQSSVTAADFTDGDELVTSEISCCGQNRKHAHSWCPSVILDCWFCSAGHFVRSPDALASGQRNGSFPGLIEIRLGEVKSGLQPAAAFAPLRAVQHTIGWGFVTLTGWGETQPWLGANGFARFIEKALVNERRDSCWAGCLHTQPRFRLTAPSAGRCGSWCFFVSCQVTLPTQGCVALPYEYKL